MNDSLVLFLQQSLGQVSPKSPISPVPSTPPVLTKQVAMEVQEEEITIRIVREAGMGLGISIAGGKGSTPYRGEDEVRAPYYGKPDEVSPFLKYAAGHASFVSILQSLC